MILNFSLVYPKRLFQGTFEGLFVPNTQLKSKLLEVSTHALKFSFTSIMPVSNSNVNCLSCSTNPTGSELIFAIAHSPFGVIMKIARGPTLSIF